MLRTKDFEPFNRNGARTKSMFVSPKQSKKVLRSLGRQGNAQGSNPRIEIKEKLVAIKLV